MVHKHLLALLAASEKILRGTAALADAVLAAVLLLTEATLTEVPEPKSEARRPVEVK